MELSSFSVAADRLAYNAKSGGKVVQGSGELLDAMKEGKVGFDDIKREQLPKEMQTLKDAELRAQLEEKSAKRAELQARSANSAEARSLHRRRAEAAGRRRQRRRVRFESRRDPPRAGEEKRDFVLRRVSAIRIQLSEISGQRSVIQYPDHAQFGLS
jgi:hypothetical protein